MAVPTISTKGRDGGYGQGSLHMAAAGRVEQVICLRQRSLRRGCSEAWVVLAISCLSLSRPQNTVCFVIYLIMCTLGKLSFMLLQLLCSLQPSADISSFILHKSGE